MLYLFTIYATNVVRHKISQLPHFWKWVDIVMRYMSNSTVVFGFLPDKTFSMIVLPFSLLDSCMVKYCTSRYTLHAVSKRMTHLSAIAFGKSKPLLINESLHECSFQKQLNSFKSWHSEMKIFLQSCFKLCFIKKGIR